MNELHAAITEPILVALGYELTQPISEGFWPLPAGLLGQWWWNRARCHPTLGDYINEAMFHPLIFDVQQVRKAHKAVAALPPIQPFTSTAPQAFVITKHKSRSTVQITNASAVPQRAS